MCGILFYFIGFERFDMVMGFCLHFEEELNKWIGRVSRARECEKYVQNIFKLKT